MIFPKLCKCTCCSTYEQYRLCVCLQGTWAGRRSTSVFSSLLGLLKHWGLSGIRTIQEKAYQVLELYRRRITRYCNYTREGLSGIGTIQGKGLSGIEPIQGEGLSGIGTIQEKDYQYWNWVPKLFICNPWIMIFPLLASMCTEIR